MNDKKIQSGAQFLKTSLHCTLIDFREDREQISGVLNLPWLRIWDEMNRIQPSRQKNPVPRFGYCEKIGYGSDYREKI